MDRSEFSWRLRFLTRWYLTCAVWSVALAVNLLVIHRRWWYVEPLLGFLACPVCFSISMRLFTGKWPDWRAAIKLLVTRNK